MRAIGLLLLPALLATLNSCNNTNANSQHIVIACPASSVTSFTSNNIYCWKDNYDSKNAIINRIPCPEGYKRVEAKQGSFANWLRFLPLKIGNPDVHLYNGELKKYQSGHAAVLDIDVGNKDLQQCADAVMRMRAEYLYSKKDFENLHFNFTSGNTVGFNKWSSGYRTVIKGNEVSWVLSALKDDSYKTFKGYMNVIFSYCGTSSLSKELKPVALKKIEIGDVFIFGGFPGHVVLVVDMCENEKTGDQLFLIQQSYMPAQDIHLLKNFNNTAFSPWYSTNFEGDLKTPEWTFSKDQLMGW